MQPAVADPIASTDKRLATLRARAALLGLEMRETRDAQDRPAFELIRWNLARVLPDLDAVEAFLCRLAGPARNH